ncbi:hypothetical protein FACS1894184_18580 [Clostridia bacterium]|nr:hypothetical protein FACS1894184_18580 [Clostridia bacterium]
MPFDEITGVSTDPAISEVISADLMFAYIMITRPDICKALIAILLGVFSIDRIEYIIDDNEISESDQPQIQKVLMSAIKNRGVRLDVYLDNGRQIFNLEMAASSEVAILKRIRAHEMMIDAHQMQRGKYFDQVKPIYVIFICKHDPLKEKRLMYKSSGVRFDHDPTTVHDDGRHRYIFYTKGTEEVVKDENGEVVKTKPSITKKVMEYFDNPDGFPVNDTDIDLIKQIHAAVGEARRSDEWRRAKMAFLEHQRMAVLEDRRKIAEMMAKNGEPEDKIKLYTGYSLADLAQK